MLYNKAPIVRGKKHLWLSQSFNRWAFQYLKEAKLLRQNKTPSPPRGRLSILGPTSGY